MVANRRVKIGFIALTSMTIIIYLLLPDNGNSFQDSRLATKMLNNLNAIGSSIANRAYCLASACFHIPSTTVGQFVEAVFQICLAQSVYDENEVSSVLPTSRIHVVVVACGDRLEETLINIKSLTLFSSEKIAFHIFADDELHQSFQNGIEAWPVQFRKRLEYILYPITFPNDGNSENWRKLFKPCASQRLFLPLVMDETIDSVLYVDTDILFISDVKDFWDLFHEFTSSQLASLCNEHERRQMGWYNRFARHPYYGETGLNSGVMLMNLTRMRKVKYKNDLSKKKMDWGEMLLPLYQKYRYNITWGDQDLLNIVFHHNPEMLHVFPCKWNYRPDHCMYGQTCQSAKEEGVKTMHGSRRVYHNDKQPTFKAVYDSLAQYDFHGDIKTNLLQIMEQKLRNTAETYCGQESDCILRGLRDTINKM